LRGQKGLELYGPEYGQRGGGDAHAMTPAWQAIRRGGLIVDDDGASSGIGAAYRIEQEAVLAPLAPGAGQSAGDERTTPHGSGGSQQRPRRGDRGPARDTVAGPQAPPGLHRPPPPPP